MKKRHTRNNSEPKESGNRKKRHGKQEAKGQQARKKGAPKWKRTEVEVEQLEKRIEEETPPPGALYYKYRQTSEDLGGSKAQEESGSKPRQAANRQILETSDKSKIKIRFADLPISKATISGLFKAQFIKMTETQRASIPHALAGRDVVACARTGSGKTLSYLIPVIEKLYKERWTSMDGLGGLVLVPTRELGIQAYEVLRSFGGYHDMSAGLVIGGKDVKKEKEVIRSMNILICTPGRLLQHMDETALFNGDNLKVLVIDEVDRLMDMGFKDTIDQIMRNLPKDVQTLLFSATIGRKVRDLARVNVQPDHEYICIHDFDSVESKLNEYEPGQSAEDRALAEKIKQITPVKLLHYYMELQIEDKLDTLFSFLKSHPKSKVLVFFSARKQVRFAYQAFKALKLAQNLFELHGKQDQNKRTAIYFQFVEKQGSAVLFATDIASRGVDFPAVDWVVQYDCPEDLNTYIHRVGRTARYKSKGSALLFLLPSEKKLVEKLQARQIDLKKLQAAPNRQLAIQPALQKMNAENNELMHLAKRACVSYLKCIHLMKDKEVFKFSEINSEKLAESLGLATSPQIDFGHQVGQVQLTKTMSRAEQRTARIKMLREQAKIRKESKLMEQQKQLWDGVSEGESVDSEESDAEDEGQEDPIEKKRQTSSHSDQSQSDEEELLVPVKKHAQESESDLEEDEAGVVKMKQKALKMSQAKPKKKNKDGASAGKNRQLLDKDGNTLSGVDAMKFAQALGHGAFQFVNEEDANRTLKEEAFNNERGGYIDEIKEKLQRNQKIDENAHRARIKELRIKKKRKMREREPAHSDLDSEDNEHNPPAERGARLAAADDGQSSDEGESLKQSEDNDEPADGYVSDDGQVREPATRRQRVDRKTASAKKSSKKAKSEKTAEQRALELLDCDF